MVMLYHLGNRTGLRPLTEWGYLGVGIFFVISGFVIASTLLETHISPGTIGRFFARRFVRLDIPYWANIAVTVALGITVYRLGGQSHNYTLGQIATHLVYMQGILGVQPINQVYWTLCLEVQFYVFLVLVLWAVQSLRLSWSAFHTALILSVVISILCNAKLLPSPRGSMLPYWWAFALGATVCWWRAKKISTARLAVTLAATSVLPFLNGEAWRITAAATGAVLVFAIYLGAESRWLSGALAQFLGRISYSLYLYHALIGWEAQTFALRYVGPYAALAFGITVSILMARLTYVLIERPAVKLSHRINAESNSQAMETRNMPSHSAA